MSTIPSPEAVAGRVVVIDYVNHRGERSMRRIVPDDVEPFYFGETAWHAGPQWLLDARDLDKDEDRTFAMKDIHSWKPL